MLDQPLINKAAENGIVLDALSFIEISSNVESDLHAEMEELCELPITAVFTSANAVRAIAPIIHEAKPVWKVYCTGAATKAALLEDFDMTAIAGIANDAAGLAEVILANNVFEVVFFCGDKRMDTLPTTLRDRDVTVHEIIVYHTIETPQKVAKQYDGILFFSPSAVNSFYKVNRTGPETVLFAIGNTTANALRAHTDSTVILGGTPSKEQLVDLAIDYFHKHLMIEHK